MLSSLRSLDVKTARLINNPISKNFKSKLHFENFHFYSTFSTLKGSARMVLQESSQINNVKILQDSLKTLDARPRPKPILTLQDQVQDRDLYH